ncbi:hypothetical protein HAX54_047168 [Datura stramonium]|uniref:Uncharacterized protein n=1 Tax=Datura stramonium TaxID=4076 RepID=A0ABS8STJ8_DATST|nr:hypothetical protein [Datura stramonium]
MMTGSRVWIYHNTKDLQWKIMNEDPIIPSNVSEIARDFLSKCFIKDPRRRWTSEQLLEHPFIQQALCTSSSNSMPETQKEDSLGYSALLAWPRHYTAAQFWRTPPNQTLDAVLSEYLIEATMKRRADVTAEMKRRNKSGEANSTLENPCPSGCQ